MNGSNLGLGQCCGKTDHVEEHDDAEVDADGRPCRGHLRVVPDQSPAKCRKRADSDHAVNDNPEHGSDHHQDLHHTFIQTY